MPNRKEGRHWASAAAIKKSLKEEVFLLTKAAIYEHQYKIDKSKSYTVEIIYHQADRRNRDVDNLLAASKSMIDGVALAIGVDDKQFVKYVISKSLSKSFYTEVILHD